MCAGHGVTLWGINLASDSTNFASAMCANAPPVRRRRRSVRRGRRIDRRTREAHAVAKLVADISTKIGDASRSPLVLADIVRCAELTVLASTARAHAMRSGGTMFDAEAVARVEGAADRARRRLSLPMKANTEPNLAQYLASLPTEETSTDAVAEASGNETPADDERNADEAAEPLGEAAQ